MANRIGEFVQYHSAMQNAGDIDPGYPMLQYVCDRFELNIEQRYWLAFLYATCYCAPTVFLIYNRFPDFELVDIAAMEEWWKNEGRDQSVFQSDRGWIRSRNQFVDMVKSYRSSLDGLTQEQKFLSLKTSDPLQTYSNCYQEFSALYQMGRFALFLYLEAVFVVTGYRMEPNGIELKEAESSRNGICYAMGWDDLITGKETGLNSIPQSAYPRLNKAFWKIINQLRTERPDERADVWNVETSLCAYKKFKKGQRFVGYYLDRQAGEIKKLENLAPHGVDWDVLWDFRAETFDHKHLKEFGGSVID